MNIYFKAFAPFILLLCCLNSQSHAVTIDFNSVSDLTNNFTLDGGVGNITNSATGGLNNSGGMSIPNIGADYERWTLNTGFTQSVGASYNISAFVYNETWNNGYGGFGFNDSPTNPIYQAGVNVHAGGANFPNYFASWGADTPSNSWLYINYLMTYLGGGTYNQSLEIYTADVSGTIGALFASASNTVVDTDLALATIIYPYFADIGQRYSMVDNFTATSTATPTPEPGTIMLMGSGIAGLASFARKRRMKTVTSPLC